MLLPKQLLCGFAIGHTGVVTILVVYSILKLLKIRRGEVTAQEGSAKLNTLVSISALIYACSTLIITIHAYRLLYVLELLILCCTVTLIAKNTKKGVYDAGNMNAEQIGNYIRNNYICLVYLVMCLAIYTKYLIEGLKAPIYWSALGLRKSLFFVSTVCLTEAVLIILVYSLVALSNIEQDSSCARDVLQNLNRLLVGKTIVHSILIFTLAAHTPWAFFVSNLQIFRCDICKIGSEIGTNLDTYEPTNILLPTEIHRQRSYNMTCFLYFCLYLGIYMDYFLLGGIGVVTSKLLVCLPMIFMEVHDMTEEWGISSVSRFCFYIFNGEIGERVRNNAYLFIHFLEWFIVSTYWAYLGVWKNDWTLRENGSWVMHMLLNVLYDMASMIFLIFAVPLIEGNGV